MDKVAMLSVLRRVEQSLVKLDDEQGTTNEDACWGWLNGLLEVAVILGHDYGADWMLDGGFGGERYYVWFAHDRKFTAADVRKDEGCMWKAFEKFVRKFENEKGN